MVKFRSMVVNADAMHLQLADRNEGAGPLFKMRNDPRVTAIGQHLRKYSLDELPQLFNVLTGSMSLVGRVDPVPDRRGRRRRRRRLLTPAGAVSRGAVSGSAACAPR